MVLDPNDPTMVTSLSIAVEGDDNPVKTLGEIHQPDNIETTQTGFLVTEDPGSSQQFVLADQGLPNATTARLWYVPFSGSPEVVVKIDQSADGGPTDVGPAPTGNLSIGNWGAWETTGIVDASAAFGPGAFLINVQAHTLWVEKAPGTDNFPPVDPTSRTSAKEDSCCCSVSPGSGSSQRTERGALRGAPSASRRAAYRGLSDGPDHASGVTRCHHVRGEILVTIDLRRRRRCSRRS